MPARERAWINALRGDTIGFPRTGLADGASFDWSGAVSFYWMRPDYFVSGRACFLDPLVTAARGAANWSDILCVLDLFAKIDR